MCTEGARKEKLREREDTTRGKGSIGTDCLILKQLTKRALCQLRWTGSKSKLPPPLFPLLLLLSSCIPSASLTHCRRVKKVSGRRDAQISLVKHRTVKLNHIINTQVNSLCMFLSFFLSFCLLRWWWFASSASPDEWERERRISI